MTGSKISAIEDLKVNSTNIDNYR